MKYNYKIDCRNCNKLKEIHDFEKNRHGIYCTKIVEAYDTGKENPIKATDKYEIVCKYYKKAETNHYIQTTIGGY